MPSPPLLSDATHVLLWKLAVCCTEDAGGGGGGAGVSSFNARVGAVVLTSLDVTTALGFVPGGGVTSFNTRTGAVTLLLGDVTPLVDSRYVFKAGDTMTGLLQFSGTTHAGLRLNNLTTAERDAIVGPANGMLIYNTTTLRFNTYDNGAWTSGFVKLAGDTMTGPLIMGGASTNSGLTLKVLSTVSRNALTPSVGMLIFNINTNHLEAYSSTSVAWEAYAKQVGDTFTGLVQFSGTTHAGLRLNNLTTVERDAIAAPTAGMTIWNTTTTQIENYTGAAWAAAGPAGGPFLPLTGGVLSGDLDISTEIHFEVTDGSASFAGGAFTIDSAGSFITGADGTVGGDLAVGVSVSIGGSLDMTGGLIQNVLNPVSAQDAATKAYVDALGTGPFLPLAGGTMVGTILFTDNSFDIGATGATRVRSIYAGTTINAQRNALGATPTDGVLLTNSTAAAVGAQQYSPALRLTGQGWRTGTSTSNSADWRIYCLPVQGSGAITSNLTFDASVAGGAFGTRLSVTNAGVLFPGSDISLGATTAYSWTSRSRISCSTDGIILVTNAAATDFTRWQFGGTTSSFPALGRNGIFLEVLAADGAATASLAVYNTKTSTTNFERLTCEWNSNVCRLWSENGSGGGTARPFVLGADETELLRFGSATTLSFFAQTAVVRQTSGANLTNSVTAGGTDDTIADYTDLLVYANDAAAIRNDIYQLARKLKQVNDGLRAYGLLT